MVVDRLEMRMVEEGSPAAWRVSQLVFRRWAWGYSSSMLLSFREALGSMSQCWEVSGMRGWKGRQILKSLALYMSKMSLKLFRSRLPMNVLLVAVFVTWAKVEWGFWWEYEGLNWATLEEAIDWPESLKWAPHMPLLKTNCSLREYKMIWFSLLDSVVYR